VLPCERSTDTVVYIKCRVVDPTQSSTKAQQYGSAVPVFPVGQSPLVRVVPIGDRLDSVEQAVAVCGLNWNRLKCLNLAEPALDVIFSEKPVENEERHLQSHGLRQVPEHGVIDPDADPELLLDRLNPELRFLQIELAPGDLQHSAESVRVGLLT
jgi:hypothetical protein